MKSTPSHSKAKQVPDLLFRKTSTCRAGEKVLIERLNIDYLDETSDKKRRNAKSRSFDSSVDYLTKEDLGQVHAGGFLFYRLVEMRSPDEPGPVGLPNDIRKDRIKRAMIDHIRKFERPGGVVGHKFIISMSKDMRDALIQKGMNPDQVLQRTLKNTMNKFREKFHYADSVGYAYGIHHDTDNLHVHVFLLSRTEKGKRVGLSDQLHLKKVKSRHKNQIGAMKKWVDAEARKWRAKIGDSTTFNKFCEKRDSEKFFYTPKQAHTPEKPKWEQSYEPHETHIVDPEFTLLEETRKEYVRQEKLYRDFHRKQINNFFSFPSTTKLFGNSHPIYAVGKLIQLFDLSKYKLVKRSFFRARQSYLIELQKAKLIKKGSYGQSATSQHRIWQEFFYGWSHAAGQTYRP